MRGVMVRAVLAAVALVVASPAMAVQLWQDADKGMTPEEVREAYPKVQEPQNKDRGNNPVPELVMPGYTVDGRDFRVEFYFGASGLEKVILQLQESVRSSKEVPLDYKALLERQYGETAAYYTEPEPLPLIKATWIDGRRDIVLYWTVVRSTEARMNITYSTRIANESEKL